MYTKDDGQRKAFSDFSDETILTKEDLIKKPSKADVKHVKRILNDFYIFDVEVPDLDTVSELRVWLKKTIMEKLN